MKRLKLLFFFLLGSISLLTSCRKDEPEPTFQGKWTLVEAKATTYDATGKPTNIFTIHPSQYAEKEMLSIEFSGNFLIKGTAEGNYGGEKLIYRINNDKLLVKATDTSDEYELATYLLNNNGLTLTTVETYDDGSKTETKLSYMHVH